MALKHPDYVFLRERSNCLAFLWRVGHYGRRVGLLGAVMGPTSVLVAYALRDYLPIAPTTWMRAIALALLALAGCFALAVSAVVLKAYVRKRGGPLNSLGQE